MSLQSTLLPQQHLTHKRQSGVSAVKPISARVSRLVPFHTNSDVLSMLPWALLGAPHKPLTFQIYSSNQT